MHLNSKKSKRQLTRIGKRLSRLDRKTVICLDQMWDAWLQSDYASILSGIDRSNCYQDFKNIRKILTTWFRQ